MSNADIVKRLDSGLTVAEIAKAECVTVASLQKRIYILRERCKCKTVAQLVGHFHRKKLIE